MIDWSSLEFTRIWPLWLALAVGALLVLVWRYRRTAVFPDIHVAAPDGRAQAFLDRVPIVLGVGLLSLLTLAMMGPSVVRVETVDQRARDFIILVDTSRSMRHDTTVRRDGYVLNFERRAGAFSEAVENPSDIPYLARYELARESLLRFLSERRLGDRVALFYFNDDPHPVSALTPNITFVIDQLAAMDDYVNWGTDIAVALDTSMSMLDRYPDKNKRTMILLTDAETRNTDGLQQQLRRLAKSNISFYVLWITTDEKGETDKEVEAFIKRAGTVGRVVTIDNPDSDNLMNALLDVGRMEAYSYEEVQRQAIPIAPLLRDIVRLGLLVWLLLITTFFRPASLHHDFLGAVK